MKRFFLLLCCCAVFLPVFAQHPVLPRTDAHDTTWQDDYRASYPILNDLVHTKLDVRFDYDKQWMYGKEWLTVQPHFYTVDSLILDAKYMDIKKVEMEKGKSLVPLQYIYDSLKLRIKLDKAYKKGEKYTVYIDYISRPNEAKVTGSAAITDAKGLYFINPTGKGGEPTQIWTQGETEANSVWMPTIDKPDQKTTQEISMTVPSKYVTLSNGMLVSKKENKDGTRTDTWKMDLPNAPYLFFMGVGDFAVVKDHYKNIPVNYYVEKQYESVARGIFGETPDMIGFFSKILDYPYPWPKYSQMVGRDYVSGAMENTTATLHQESAYQNARELVDGNRWEGTIAHELFHHWFGDLVTMESWSNITLNESFANYSEYLWAEHRHGKDYADEENYNEMEGYLNSGSDDKDLVRFYYKNKEDVFDAVSYNKGGRILHMLRNYVGDSAFFKSLNLYLKQHQYQSAEAHQLRLAFEKVTGLDLNWFWNQWYFGSGQPTLDISYQYQGGQQRVVINQIQKSEKIFKIPMAIDVYTEAVHKKRYQVWLNEKSDTLYFPAAQRPSWVSVDADKTLLARKKDHQSAEAFLQQYKYGSNYLDRREALEYFAQKKSDLLALGLGDSFAGLRLLTLQLLKRSDLANTPSVLATLEKMAASDPDKKTQGMALEILADQKDGKYEPLFTRFIKDSSYSVAGASLEGLVNLHPDQAVALARQYSKDAKGKLGEVVSNTLFKYATEGDFMTLLHLYQNTPLSQEKVMQTINFAHYLAGLDNTANVKMGIDELVKLRSQLPEMYWTQIDQETLIPIITGQEKKGKTELVEYIKGLLAK